MYRRSEAAFAIYARFYSAANTGKWVDAVGYGVHTITWVHLTRHFGMVSGNTIDIFAHVQRQPGHVQVLITTQVLECGEIEEIAQSSTH